MGRLFWKFFFFIWLAQLAAVIGVGTTLWLEHRYAGDMHPPPPGVPHRPGEEPPHAPPPGGMPPPPPEHGLHFGLPLTAGSIASLVFAALLAWYFSKPIRNLRAAFDDAAAGRLDVRAGPIMGERRDELADLGHDFDRMASRLQALIEGQRRLLHDVSHELRSPLARLQAAIGLARQQPEKFEATLVRIERESVRMDQLVGELLALSRLEAGVPCAQDEDINMRELLDEIIADARFEAQAGGRMVEQTGDCDAIIHGNPELLYRALENVLRNAVKHTAAGSSITIDTGVLAPERRLRISVLDRGPGVPETELKAVFDPFFRSSSTSKHSDGHGLGLAIAQRVVAAHGGAIHASNRTDGGLRVDVMLPLNDS